MMPIPPSFTGAELVETFPEFQVLFPELGVGSFKAAYRVVRADGDAVLKEPASILDDAGEVALPPRLEREIAAMQRVRSRRVVQVLAGPGIRDIGGAPHVWYVEPFYAGGTLATSSRPIAPRDALALADALLGARVGNRSAERAGAEV